jgi:hypothetical protein
LVFPNFITLPGRLPAAVAIVKRSESLLKKPENSFNYQVEDQHPDDYDNQKPGPAMNLFIREFCFRMFPVFFKYIFRHQADCIGDPCRNNDQVIQVAEDGDKIRNEINRAQCIGNRQDYDYLRTSWYPWIISGKIEGIDIALQIVCTLPE